MVYLHLLNKIEQVPVGTTMRPGSRLTVAEEEEEEQEEEVVVVVC